MRKYVTVAISVCISASMGAAFAQAQSRPKIENTKTKKITVKKKTTRSKVKTTSDHASASQVDTSSANVAAALNADLVGECYKLDGDGGSKLNYEAICAGTRTDKRGKHVDCTGNENESNPGTYNKYTCTVQNISGDRRFEISTRSGGHIDVGDVADMACGCGRHVSQMTCSGGLCYISRR